MTTKSKNRVLAYQAGITYPAFVDVERHALASIFLEHGFERSSRRLLDFDAPRALAAVAARIGPQRRDRLRVSALAELDDSSHIVGFQIDRLVPSRGVSQSLPGARVLATKTRVTVCPPRGGELRPDCKVLADELRAKALRLVTHADIGAVSRSVTYVFEESNSLPFISRGTFVVLADSPTTDRVVSCLRAIRKHFYDPVRRTGLRASVLEVIDSDSNRAAVVDAVVDDWQRGALELVTQLRADVKKAPAREMTCDGRRAAAEEYVRRLRWARAFAPEAAEKLKKIGNAVAEAYCTPDGKPLLVPTWLEEATREFAQPDSE
jgi:hypothetical protein